MQPKPKTQEAYEFLQSYQGLTNPDSFQFHRWLREGDQLIHKHTVDAYLLKSFAYILLGEPTKALYNMENAHRLGATHVSRNLMNIFYTMGDFEKSSQIALQNIPENPQTLYYVRALLSNSLLLLAPENIHQVVSLYHGKDNEIVEYESKDMLDQITIRESLLKKLNINKEIFVKIFQKIHYFLSHHYVGDSMNSVTDEYTEIGGNLRINVFLKNIDIEHCLKFNDLFLEELINDDLLDFDEYKSIMVSFIPAQYADKVA